MLSRHTAKSIAPSLVFQILMPPAGRISWLDCGDFGSNHDAVSIFAEASVKASSSEGSRSVSCEHRITRSMSGSRASRMTARATRTSMPFSWGFPMVNQRPCWSVTLRPFPCGGTYIAAAGGSPSPLDRASIRLSGPSCARRIEGRCLRMEARGTPVPWLRQRGENRVVGVGSGNRQSGWRSAEDVRDARAAAGAVRTAPLR